MERFTEPGPTQNPPGLRSSAKKCRLNSNTGEIFPGKTVIFPRKQNEPSKLNPEISQSGAGRINAKSKPNNLIILVLWFFSSGSGELEEEEQGEEEK